MNLKRSVKQYLLYNIIFWPLVIALYAPYQILIIHYTTEQIIRWLETSLWQGMLANLVIQPVAHRVIPWIGKIK